MLLWKMAFRNLRRRKSRNALTIIAIMLGVSLLVGINIAASGAMAEFENYIRQIYGETDVIVRYGNQMPFGEGNISAVEGIPEVEKYAERTIWPARLDNDTRKAAGLVGIDTNTDWEFAGFNITGSREVHGTDVVIGNTLAENHRLGIGDFFNLTIKAYNTEIWNRTLSLSVIGIYYPTPPATSIDVFTNFAYAQGMSGLTGMVSTILVKLKDPSMVATVRDQLQDNLDPEFEVLAPKIEAEQQIEGQLAGFQAGLTVMAMIALLVSGFLVFNTMFMAIHERIYEIGVLRATGSSRRQIFSAFLSESLILGLIGTCIGIPTGVALSNLFAFLFERAFGISKITIMLTLDISIGGFIGGLVMSIGGALYPAVSASRINVIQALRQGVRAGRRAIPDFALLISGLVLVVVGVLLTVQLIPYVLPFIGFLDVIFVPVGMMILVAVLLKRAARILVSPVRFVSSSIGALLSRNARRKLLRNTVSFGIIAMSLTFVIVIGGLKAGVVDAVEKGAREAWGADIVLLGNQTIPRTFVSNLTSIEEVETATAVGMFPTTKVFSNSNESTVTVLAVEPDTFPHIIKYTFIDSPPINEVYQELTTNNESLILPQSLADKLGVSVGQNITVLTVTGEKKNFTVAGIFTGAILQQIWFGERPMTESILISFQSKTAHFDGRDEAMLFFLNLKNGYKEKAADVVDIIDSAYPQYDFGERTMTFQGLLSQVRSQINQLFSIFLVFLYFTILIGALGIAIIMIMNVTERRREIGLLRSQGMSRRQILSLFLSEAALMGLLGFLVALPSGLILLKGVTSTADITGFWFPYIIPWSAIGQSVIFALIAAIVGAIYPAYKASRLSITTSLQRR